MIAPYASSAFCNGWAEVDAPITLDREALSAAIAAAESHESAPGILEAVRRTGRTTALYHALDGRRDDLVARFAAQIHPLIRALLKVAAPLIVNHLAPASEAIADPPPASGVQLTVQQVLDSLGITEAYRAWSELTGEALIEGTADGTAGAALWLASARGEVLPSFDLEFSTALDRLQNMHGPWLDPSTWMGRQTHGLAYQMGRSLADGIACGADRQSLLDIISATGADPWTVNSVLDYAISGASSQGALDLYASEGVMWVSVLVSPGACEECDGLDADNPYEIADTPDLPQHPNCRCALSPETSNPNDVAT